MGLYRYWSASFAAITLASALGLQLITERARASESVEQRAGRRQLRKIDGDAPQVADATPAEAIKSFYGAMDAGDVKSARSLLLAPEKFKKWLDVQIKLCKSFRRFSLASISAFGDEGKSLQLPSPAAIAVEKLKTVKLVEEGDKAYWPTNPKLPLRLVRVEGHWKLDMAASFEKPEHVELLGAELGRVAEYVAQIARGMEDGKFNSIAEVRDELKRQR